MWNFVCPSVRLWSFGRTTLTMQADDDITGAIKAGRRKWTLAALRRRCQKERSANWKIVATITESEFTLEENDAGFNCTLPVVSLRH